MEMTRAEIKAGIREHCAGVGYLLECLRKLDAMEFRTALSAFQARHRSRYGYLPSDSAIARAAGVNRSDFRRIKAGLVPMNSVMTGRASRFLDGDTEIARPLPGGRPKKQVRENHSISY